LVYLFFQFTETTLAPGILQFSKGEVCFEHLSVGRCFQVEIAKTALERDRGLMHRESLDKNKGMLFIFDREGIYPFWMKNTLIALDIIWIDENNKVVFIKQNAQPCETLICPSVIPSAKAKYVLEINAGLVERLQIKTGDYASFKN
jgi:uncharacterized membrane protein (UPF0127 family)